jgi:hypothetical protein
MQEIANTHCDLHPECKYFFLHAVKLGRGIMVTGGAPRNLGKKVLEFLARTVPCMGGDPSWRGIRVLPDLGKTWEALAKE